MRIDRERMLERFLAYARVETTSDEGNPATPSSECQWNLARMLVPELEALGLQDVRLDEHCYVYGVLPENLPAASPRRGRVPAIGFIAHMDVSPALSGKDVQPIVHRGYAGGPIRLSDDVVLTPETDAPLGDCVGLDVVTSDGRTLLGADDKAGIAIIMTVLEYLQSHPEVAHGPVHVAFTPDEEIGRGVAKFQVAGFGAEVAYTVDGESLGEVEDETFCADSMTVTFHGVSVHPGYAKGKMINSIKLAGRFLDRLPRDTLSPETTEGREGYVHPRLIEGNEEKATVKLLIRDFTTDKLGEHEHLVEELARAVVAEVPGSRVECKVDHSYKNMKVVLDQRPEATAFAEEALRRVGLSPKKRPIRGGTDGASLSFLGLPTPNIFTGGHNFHGRREWIAVQHMEKSAQACIELVRVWAEKGERKGLLPKLA